MWKKVEAILRPYKIQEIIEVLKDLQLIFYIEESMGFGKRLSPLSLYSKKESSPAIESLPRTKLTVVVREELVEQVVNLIREKGGTGIVGDGKVFVEPVLGIIDIYSQEIDE
jgi:nitrogen regulatory protein P-II 1